MISEKNIRTGRDTAVQARLNAAAMAAAAIGPFFFGTVFALGDRWGMPNAPFILTTILTFYASGPATRTLRRAMATG